MLWWKDRGGGATSDDITTRVNLMMSFAQAVDRKTTGSGVDCSNGDGVLVIWRGFERQ